MVFLCSLSDFAELNHNIPELLVWNYLVDLLMVRTGHKDDPVIAGTRGGPCQHGFMCGSKSGGVMI